MAECSSLDRLFQIIGASYGNNPLDLCQYLTNNRYILVENNEMNENGVNSLNMQKKMEA